MPTSSLQLFGNDPHGHGLWRWGRGSGCCAALYFQHCLIKQYLFDWYHILHFIVLVGSQSRRSGGQRGCGEFAAVLGWQHQHDPDRSGNPVLDGTTVNFFSTEGGFVASSCKTVNNFCSVTWTPDDRDPADGRAQIFAVVKGGEYFADFKGNYIFDDGDLVDAANYDLGEPYSDNNTYGMHQHGEHFIDTDYNQEMTAPNGVWNGPNCQEAALCGDRTYTDLGQQTTAYMSNGRNPTIFEMGSFMNFSINVDQTMMLSGLYLSDGNSAADNPGHPLPNGTKVSFAASGGTLTGTTRVGHRQRHGAHRLLLGQLQGAC